VKGAYALLILANNKLIAVRDPHGFRPLALGRVAGAHVFASETCAFDLLEAEFIRSLDPGEMVVIEDTKVQSYKIETEAPTRQCIFELIYFARPDSLVFGEDVYQCRKRMGQELARESAPDVDFVMPFPDSGVYSAVGFAQESGLPYEHAMIRNHYVGRTFIQPTQELRDLKTRLKLSPTGAVKGKRVVLVDDSIVRGTTSRRIVRMLKEAGALVRFLPDPYVHAKVLVRDGEEALLGSLNLSANSIQANRELAVRFTAREAPEAFRRLLFVMEGDWEKALPENPFALPPVEGVIPWQEAPRYFGRVATVEGVIQAVEDRGTVAFLKFGPGESDLRLVAFPRSYGLFAQPFPQSYLGKKVRARGRIVLYAGYYEIVLEGPENLEVLDGGP